MYTVLKDWISTQGTPTATFLYMNNAGWKWYEHSNSLFLKYIVAQDWASKTWNLKTSVKDEALYSSTPLHLQPFILHVLKTKWVSSALHTAYITPRDGKWQPGRHVPLGTQQTMTMACQYSFKENTARVFSSVVCFAVHILHTTQHPISLLNKSQDKMTGKERLFAIHTTASRWRGKMLTTKYDHGGDHRQGLHSSHHSRQHTPPTHFSNWTGREEWIGGWMGWGFGGLREQWARSVCTKRPVKFAVMFS